MKLACFDLKGVLVDHRDLTKKIPLMEEFLGGLARDGWKLCLLSSFPKEEARRILDSAGIRARMDIVDTVERDKGKTLASLIEEKNAEEIVFIDDKPANLESVRNIQNNNVRIIGFIGSMKYVPSPNRIAHWCLENNIELALSAIDLCEAMNTPLCCPDLSSMDIKELISLIPGLDHPMSAIAGETANFDHRSVFAEILARDISGHKEAILRKMGWIMCHECLLKTLVEVAIVSAGENRQDILGKAYKYGEYVEALHVVRNKSQLIYEIKKGIGLLREGVNEIGIEAEACRPKGRDIDRNRLNKLSGILSEIID